MLWYRSWLESRWRFFTGLILITGLCAVTVLTHPLMMQAMQGIKEPEGWLGEIMREEMAVTSTYPGYIWSQWFGRNLLQAWTVFAILMGVGGIVTESTRGTSLFTLSLPVTRRRLLGIRAAAGAAELAVLAIAPSLLVPALSLLIGESYALTDTFLYALMMIVGGLVFFSFSFLLSTIFSDQLKPVIIGLSVAFAIVLLSLLFKEFAPYSIYYIMSGGDYFSTGTLPVAGLSASLAAAAVMFYVSLRVVERRDF